MSVGGQAEEEKYMGLRKLGEERKGYNRAAYKCSRSEFPHDSLFFVDHVLY